jgi:CBS domain-containing protein
MTQVSEVMTRGVRTLTPQDSIVRAAQAMDELDVGVIPVCEGDQLVGMVTDRDIVVRGLTKGGPVEGTRLADVMTQDPRWCFEDQSLDEVLEQMREVRIRRIAVFDHERHLVGMLSLGDVAVKADGDGAGAVLQEISEPAAPDRSGRIGTDTEPANGGHEKSGAAGDGGATAARTSGEEDRQAGALITRSVAGSPPPPEADPTGVEDANRGREHQGEGVLNRQGRFGSSSSPEELGAAPE